MSILGLGKQQPPLKTKDCPECEGKGYIICPECDGKGKFYPFNSISYCNHCNGKGKYTCDNCHGLGWVKVN